MNEMPIKITPEYIIDLIIRRRWYIMLPLCVALVSGIALAILLPEVFEAKTLILVEGQRVPQNYVQSIVTEDTAQRINTISQQILSRTNLEKIINDFGLFSSPNADKMFIEDKVASLRRRISVDVLSDRRRETEAFTITFKDTDPQKVMLVANGLASSFIDQNLKNRESQATGTSDFLEAELQSMKLKLEKVEENIKNYRKTNMGELPEQLETNLRILERLQEDLTDRQQSLRAAQARLAELNNQALNREPSVVVIGGDQTQREGSASLEELYAQLESLKARYTEKHPDIQRIKKQIADLESKNTQDVASGNSEGLSARIPLAMRQQIFEVKTEIQNTESEIEDLRNKIAEYQRRTENIPRREQELLGLNRDYQNIRATYESLLARKLEADIAVNMERKQKGEQFRILDPAKVPERPVDPDLKKLFLLMVALGFGLGGGLAFLLDIVKPSFRKPNEIEEQYELPVLVSIPKLLQPKQMLLRRANQIASVVFSVLVLGLIGIYGFISMQGPDIAIETLRKIVGS